MAGAHDSLPLNSPAIVILFDSTKEQKQHHEPGYEDAMDDFTYAARRMQKALEGHPEIKVQWSSAASVRFPGTRYDSVRRDKLEDTWGYVFYRPGQKPAVVGGIQSDSDLVCIAVQLFAIRIEKYDCAP